MQSVCDGGGLDRADMNHSERFNRFHDTTGHRSRSFYKVWRGNTLQCTNRHQNPSRWRRIWSDPQISHRGPDYNAFRDEQHYLTDDSRWVTAIEQTGILSEARSAAAITRSTTPQRSQQGPVPWHWNEWIHQTTDERIRATRTTRETWHPAHICHFPPPEKAPIWIFKIKYRNTCFIYFCKCF